MLCLTMLILVFWNIRQNWELEQLLLQHSSSAVLSKMNASVIYPCGCLPFVGFGLSGFFSLIKSNVYVCI